MKVATWNVNGIRARLENVLAWLRRHEPDVVCLQETKVVDEQFPWKELETVGYRAAWYGQPSYNGVAILSRAEPQDVVKGMPGEEDPDQRRVIAATVGGVRFIDVYVPNGKTLDHPDYAFKLRWLDRMAAWIDEAYGTDRPIVLCGDFNIAPEDRDVHKPERWKNKVLVSEPERERYRNLVDRGFQDAQRVLTDEAGIFTWWDYRLKGFERNWGLRIDLFLLTPPLAGKVQRVWVDKEERGRERPSDHAPVLAELEVHPD